ncbi:hypothetical protein [Gracilibacillus halophilus]|nr:hypothetical protein [Gracilibacillus halophilus]
MNFDQKLIKLESKEKELEMKINKDIKRYFIAKVPKWAEQSH